MAKAKFDIKTIELPALPAAATRPIYAGVGATDLAVEVVRDYVSDVQKRFAGVQKSVTELDFEPKALRDQAVTVVSDNVVTVADTYTDLAKRGESLVGRIRRQESTKATVSSAKTTVAKVKTTNTQATKATRTTAKATKSAAKRATSTAKKSSGPSRSSAKATATAAKKTASNATKATTAAASKVGD